MKEEAARSARTRPGPAPHTARRRRPSTRHKRTPFPRPALAWPASCACSLHIYTIAPGRGASSRLSVTIWQPTTELAGFRLSTNHLSGEITRAIFSIFHAFLVTSSESPPAGHTTAVARDESPAQMITLLLIIFPPHLPPLLTLCSSSGSLIPD